MAKVDSKGRIVLPQRVRERLGIEPGTEVEVHEEDGKAVVKPEDNPEAIIERMEALIDETSPASRETRPLDADVDPVAQKHRDAVRRGAEQESDA
ncbi:AbrB/MazE/SpoVT family DNA-binding domain-containing protein [Halobellus rufus]|uniref:AbrB/MazE/SpoVT family DNA-binding domain-containing protein n=1 Tax=Halobellus rufus TaxID=1448860 RepID=UPI000679B33F|nr:AbrB/MazE/SpoVT family DNA-binding domain-containing protein [Halobellus rufus]